MSLRVLQTLETLSLRDDDRLDATEAQRLVDASRDRSEVTLEERAHLVRTAASPRTTLEGRNVIERFLAAPLEPFPLRAHTGADASGFSDDLLVLGPDGTMRGNSSVTPHSRSYAAVHKGPLRERHGSPPPKSVVLTPSEQARVASRTPGQALDAMGRERGLTLGFDALAHAKSSFDPEAPAWWGKCHAWAWAALSTELSARVDVGGPEGQRGLWFAGQWLSRAELGNVLMTVADRISLRDGSAFFRSNLTPADLLQATAQFLLEGGGGFVADLHNDAAHGGEREVWNQPFVAADVTTKTLSGEGAAFVLALAEKEGRAGVAVKHVHLVGRYGNEKADDWEGEWHPGSRSWNVYAVTDENGVVVAAYQADDEQLDGARGLPSRQSHELPEYVWKPSLGAIDAGFSGARHPAIDGDALAREYRFFLGEVLTKGVPGSMRADFEAAVPARPVSADEREALRVRFKGVAEAYTVEQWERAFGAKGLERAVFL